MVTSLGNGSGIDYIIANGNQSIAIQRKTCDEVFQQMEKIRSEIVPALKEHTENPVLLIEELFAVGKDGHMYRKQNGFLHEVGLNAYSYYNFINSIRLMGCEVVCTRNLDQSIWWMAAAHKYIGDTHYPKLKKQHDIRMQAVGSLCCINSFGETISTKILQEYSIRELMDMDRVELSHLLTQNQLLNFTSWADAKIEPGVKVVKEKIPFKKKRGE